MGGIGLMSATLVIGCMGGPEPPDAGHQLATVEAALVVCTPGDEAYCYYQGQCNSDGTECECYDPDHRSPAERCQIWHSVVVPPGKLCLPGDASYCHYNGTCDADGQGCTCKDWFHGPNCAVTAADCPGYGEQPDGGWSNAVCGGHGVCVAAGVCECEDGFTGPACSGVDVEPCDPDPCENGGVCAEVGATFDCDCPPQYQGDTCDQDVNECADGTHNCPATKVCANTVGGFTCEDTSVGASTGNFDHISAGTATIGEAIIGKLTVDTFSAGSSAVGADLFVDDTSNRVGILTEAPTSTLDVNGTGRFRSALTVQGSTNLRSTLQVGSTGRILYVDNGSRRVGVNTSSPQASLHVVGTSRFTSAMVAQTTLNVSSDLRVGTGSSGNDLFVDDSRNRVGIGTSLPDRTLDVNGPARLRGSLQADGNIRTEQALTVSKAAQVTGDLSVGSGGQVMRVNTQTRRVGIGDSTPSEKLDVAGNTRAHSFLLRSPRSAVWKVSPAAFRPQTQYTTVWLPNTRMFSWPHYAGSGTAFCGDSGSGCSARAYAPVNLPDGATVSNLTCRYADDSSANDFGHTTVELTRRSILSATQTTMAEVDWKTTGDSPNVLTQVDTSISDATIDNNQADYQLTLSARVTGHGTALRFYGCRIVYRYGKLGH